MFGSPAAAGIGLVIDGVLAVGGLLAPAESVLLAMSKDCNNCCASIIISFLLIRAE